MQRGGEKEDPSGASRDFQRKVLSVPKSCWTLEGCVQGTSNSHLSPLSVLSSALLKHHDQKDSIRKKGFVSVYHSHVQFFTEGNWSKSIKRRNLEAGSE